jgi:hypothetical protein
MGTITVITTPIIQKRVGFSRFENIKITDEILSWFVGAKFSTISLKYKSPYEITWADMEKGLLENTSIVDIQKLDLLKEELKNACVQSIFISSVFVTYCD